VYACRRLADDLCNLEKFWIYSNNIRGRETSGNCGMSSSANTVHLRMFLTVAAVYDRRQSSTVQHRRRS